MFTTNLEDLLALTSQLEEKSKVVKTEISQARERMEAEKAIWEKEKEEMANRYKIDDVLITLNVGGKELATYKSVLTSVEGSMLAAMFSGRHPFTKDGQGRYFIDRNGEVFSYILDYLRSGVLIYPTDPAMKRRMLDDMTFFGLTPEFNYFSGSNVIEEGDKSKLADLFPSLEEAKLVYRATTDGWLATHFHNKCNGLRDTICLVKVGTYAFGGYTPLEWGSTGGYKYDATGKSFLFSLRNPSQTLEGVSLPNTGPNAGNTYTIYDNSSYGVTFGGGHDLYVASDANANTSSYVNLGHSFRHPSFAYGTNEAKNFFCGTYNFTPAEVEVYVVKFSS